jgi:hypothetical protein
MSDSTEGVAEGQVTAMKKGASQEKAEPAAEAADAQPSEPPAEDKENSNE